MYFRMNPNYLLRDELVYELAIRGVNLTEDVQLLCGLFRSVLAEDIPVTPKNLVFFLDFRTLGFY